MQAIAHGDAEVADWEALYFRLRPTLTRALVAIAGRYEGVEDAIQDAFAEAISRAPSDLQSAEAWLFTVARNRLRRQYRWQRLQERIGLKRADPDSDLDRTLLRLDVVRRLQALSARDRELLVAKHYVGMTQEEISSSMGLPRGTVSAAISRAAARYRAMEAK